jgi:hypothetical protein
MACWAVVANSLRCFTLDIGDGRASRLLRGVQQAGIRREHRFNFECWSSRETKIGEHRVGLTTQLAADIVSTVDTMFAMAYRSFCEDGF